MLHPSFVLRALAAAAFCAAGVAHANLLANGSFESGAFVNQGNDTMSPPNGSTVITGWTVVGDTIAWIGPTNPFIATVPSAVPRVMRPLFAALRPKASCIMSGNKKGCAP